MAEECLIDETFNVFSDKDNESFLSFPNEEEVKKSSGQSKFMYSTWY